MVKISVIIIATLLIQQLAARHIVKSLEVDTKISVTVEEHTSNFNMEMEHSLEELLKFKRDILDVRSNCHCINNGRCSKRTTCSEEAT